MDTNILIFVLVTGVLIFLFWERWNGRIIQRDHTEQGLVIAKAYQAESECRAAEVHEDRKMIYCLLEDGRCDRDRHAQLIDTLTTKIMDSVGALPPKIYEQRAAPEYATPPEEPEPPGYTELRDFVMSQVNCQPYQVDEYIQAAQSSGAYEAGEIVVAVRDFIAKQNINQSIRHTEVGQPGPQPFGVRNVSNDRDADPGNSGGNEAVEATGEPSGPATPDKG